MLHLVLLIHAHQPVGNFDDVLEQAYQRAYLPFAECLKLHPSIRLGLHYSGPLLEWVEKRHPEFFELLRELVERGQVELLGGGFYEPILIAIPPEDRQEQIRRLADYIEKHFGRRPRGAWLAERVWEPQLPSTFAQTGVDYTLVDDSHFQAAGLQLEQLHGYYVTDDLGFTVNVIPGLKALRYLIPFHSVEETLDYLRTAAGEYPGGLAAMGDDCEKFGVWPGTHDHCYRDGWLERFFAALEANADWLETSTPGGYLVSHAPLGRADLPTASYPELMEWALPAAVRQRFHAVLGEFGSREDVQSFLRGGFWRGFFSKYAEANLLHKKMLHVSSHLRRLAAGGRRRPAARRELAEATTSLLRAQCNDAYWHGIFGGLYAPHLRTALWRELVRAEKIADAMGHHRARYAGVARLDFDADGSEEVYLCARGFAALLKPSDGGTLAALDCRARDVTLINSIQRRFESYHKRLAKTGNAANRNVASIHEQTRAKEAGLDSRLRYDRWPRHAFRLLLFAPGKSYADYEALRLEECATFAGGAYQVLAASPEQVELSCDGPWSEGMPVVRAAKRFSFSATGDAFVVGCELQLSHAGPQPLSVCVGLELVLNLLAGEAHDRYFETAERIRHPLCWAAAIPAATLRLVDEWQKVALTIEAPKASEFWIAPIETISESEDGFERVYQGSQILALWPAELAANAPWTAQLHLRVTPLA